MFGSNRPSMEELKTMVGRKGQEAVVEVDRSMVRRFCECTGDANPKWQQEAPTGLLFSAMFFGTGFPVDFPYIGVVDLGSEVEYHRDVRPGDVIRTVTEFVDIQDKSNEKGRRAFMTFRSTHVNQRGETVAVSISRMMSFG